MLPMSLFSKPLLLLITLVAFSWWPHPGAPKAPSEERAAYPQLLEAEQQRRQQAETRAELQAQSRERWQTAAAGLGAASVVVLLVGIHLGSCARHEASSSAR